MLHDIFQFDSAVAFVAYILNKRADKQLCLQHLYNILFDVYKEQLLYLNESLLGDSFYVTEHGFEPVIIANLFNWKDSRSADWHAYFNTLRLEEQKFAYLLRDPGEGELSSYSTAVLDSAWGRFVNREPEVVTGPHYYDSYPEILSFQVAGKKVHISAEDIFRVNKALNWKKVYTETIQTRHEMFNLFGK